MRLTPWSPRKKTKRRKHSRAGPQTSCVTAGALTKDGRRNLFATSGGDEPLDLAVRDEQPTSRSTLGDASSAQRTFGDPPPHGVLATTSQCGDFSDSVML